MSRLSVAKHKHLSNIASGLFDDDKAVPEFHGMSKREIRLVKRDIRIQNFKKNHNLKNSSFYSSLRRNRILRKDERDKYFERKKGIIKHYRKNSFALSQRTMSNLHSSSYLFDFTTGSLKSLFILLILLMGIYQVFILGIGVNNLNTFENGISLLQLCSDTGINLKQNLNSSFLELFSINFQFSNIDSFKDGFLAFLDLLILPFKSIYQLFSFIFSFLSTGFNLLMGILRLLMGV